MLNPHHLELFYYVARHRGISRAVRHMPYGIQQPGLSGQLLQLEKQLGTKLFLRTPFALTPEGEALYGFVRPFFEQLDAMEHQLRTGFGPQLRLGAAEPVLRDHLPAVLREVQRAHPALRLQLRSGYQPEFESWLLDREIDLAVTALDRRPAPGLSRQLLARLPLVLLVPKRSPLRDAASLWARPAFNEPLISIRESETISRHFQRGLVRYRRAWTPSIVASSLETVAQFVADGYGLGVGLAGTALHRNVRALPLDDFPVVEIVALWLGRPSPVVTAALDAMRTYAAARWPVAGS
ncbi:LysR family transcriptional regulator [Horticoccus sp. 23ND18S-11]|uniref:LysR family transcriptional regulator n=1 Tax=Horticoccus sp. 23ND18S-11 TaxID=3391832 RepID=UPI0039C95B79